MNATPRTSSQRLARALIVTNVSLWTCTAGADNGPEQGQRRTEQELLPKVAAACEIALSLAYDSASLRAHNQDIRDDQTDGRLACNEPLRYLWYACQSAAGRAAVRAARVNELVCRGTAQPTGSLRRVEGALVVERAYREDKYYVRARRQFERELKVPVPIAGRAEDPYHDQRWSDLAQQPNPVASTRDYCMVNGTKVAPGNDVHETFARRKEDAKVQCWRDGKLVTDLTLEKGRKSGRLTTVQGDRVRQVHYRDDQQHGEETLSRSGKVESVSSYERGTRVWLKQYHASGTLARYLHVFESGSAELTQREDGKTLKLQCVPEAATIPELRGPCGFSAPSTVELYDGTGKVARLETWNRGVLEKRAPGGSAYGERSEVSFRNGKKHGTERVHDEAGKITATIVWRDGQKDGKEQAFFPGSERVAKEVVWKSGQPLEATEYYMNGAPKLRERFEGLEKKDVTEYWDSGEVARAGRYVMCARASYGGAYREWCREGLHRSFYERGARRAEETYHLGKLHGTSLHWFEGGKPERVEDYVDGRRSKLKSWNEEGKLVTDEEYEVDGSRKLKR